MGRLRRAVRSVVRVVVGWIPERYSGGRLDRFGPEQQQDIMANQFRSGL